jgi:hypothetical protein
MTRNAETAPRRARPKRAAKTTDPLWSLTAEQRVRAMRQGELTWAELFAWARRAPDEVPLVNGEFAFIAAFTPEAAEADD